MRILLAAVMAAFFVSTAHAQQPICGARTDLVDILRSEYGETLSALGVINGGRVLEVHISPSGGWTILITREDGMSCVDATGEAWQNIPQSAPGDPS